MIQLAVLALVAALAYHRFARRPLPYADAGHLARIGAVLASPSSALVRSPAPPTPVSIVLPPPPPADDLAHAAARLSAALVEARAAVDHARRLRERKAIELRIASALVVDGEEGARGLVRDARQAGRDRVLRWGEREGPVRRLSCGVAVRSS